MKDLTKLADSHLIGIAQIITANVIGHKRFEVERREDGVTVHCIQTYHHIRVANPKEQCFDRITVELLWERQMSLKTAEKVLNYLHEIDIIQNVAVAEYEDNLIEIAKGGDITEFINEFDEVYGTASAMWLNEGQKKTVVNMYETGQYVWVSVNEENVKTLEDNNWCKLFEYHEGDTYDVILYKPKKYFPGL